MTIILSWVPTGFLLFGAFGILFGACYSNSRLLSSGVVSVVLSFVLQGLFVFWTLF